MQNDLQLKQNKILSQQATNFLTKLHHKFSEQIKDLLAKRQKKQQDYNSGIEPNHPQETDKIRCENWKIKSIPHDLQRRKVEITGPVDRKMIINGLNSGADVFMADFEDATAPTWDNIIDGQVNLFDAVRKNISYNDEKKDKNYKLNNEIATLIVRPRGLHLKEYHFRVNNEQIDASLFDFGLFFFHNGQQLIENGSGPYFYIPKLQNYQEARLWNDIFNFAQDELGISRGTIKATVLLETLPAVFEMDEILYELKDHCVGLNCGRWDYIFSYIKTFQQHENFVIPDRQLVNMTQPFMNAYSELLVKTCHRRGAYAMGGMAAQIPIKNDESANNAAIEKVCADKKREVNIGHDGTWVAHPGLVQIAKNIFDDHMHSDNQLSKLRQDVNVSSEELIEVPTGRKTLDGLKHNIRVGTLYMTAWLSGQGCVPLYNLMEDTATAEICRAQVWQWLKHKVRLYDGTLVTKELVSELLHEELEDLENRLGAEHFAKSKIKQASQIFFELSTRDNLADFLTTTAYKELVNDDFVVNNIVEKPAKVDFIAEKDIYVEAGSTRFAGIKRPYSKENVAKLRGNVQIQYSLAQQGAAKLWELLNGEDAVVCLGAVTGNQAVQQAKAGLKAIYCSGWQVAADANAASKMYPDLSLYPANSVPSLVAKINHSLHRADQIDAVEGKNTTDWMLPIVADAEAGFGGVLNAYELMKNMIEAGASGVHFEDQLSSAKKCGHMGGKVLVPTSHFINTLVAARLAADVMNVETVLVARTDAGSAKLLTSDIDKSDHEFMTGKRTSEGFYEITGGIDCAIKRALAYAPYADLLWCETSTPDLNDAKKFAQSVHEKFPNKLLAYNCSPSFNWKKYLDDATIAKFQTELREMGYRFQFVTLAGFHSLNYSMFNLAKEYKESGMSAYAQLQQREFATEEHGYTATKHQREVGSGYFDEVSKIITKGQSSTLALEDSTESQQF